MPTRRDILRWAAAATLLAAPRPALAAPPARRTGPRYFVSIFLSGGVDPIYTADPKLASEVEPWVDVPYGRDAIVDAGAFQLGPHFAPLAPVAARLAVLRGVALHTANHNTGSEQFLRMKTGTKAMMPSLLQLLGEARDGQAVGCMDWLFGSAQLGRLFDGTPAADLRELAVAIRDQEERIRGDSALAARRVTAQSLAESADLCERVAALPRPRWQRWSDDVRAQDLALSLQRILWLLENDLVRSFELNVGGVDQPWDTHTFNAERQAGASQPIAIIARFLAELGRRRGRRGVLADEALVIMGSEIGRFPALNTQHGKDHFPEAPLLLFGAGIRAGKAYGRTGHRMQANRISLRSGQDTTVDGHALSLDDVGTTLLHLGGVADPTVYGYDGRVLDFLVSA